MEKKPRTATKRARKQAEPIPIWLAAVQAAQEKQAINIRVIDLREVTTFADYFVICSGSNPRQIQAISDGIGKDLKKVGELPTTIEGYGNSEWILMDYGDCLIHIFSEKARAYYELDRLWRHALEVPVPAE